jgi:hypothetical protein
MAAWLSGVAAVVALIWSVAWSIYSSKKLATEAKARREGDDREESRREEELHLLRQQLQLDEQQVERGRSAEMTAVLVSEGPIPTNWQGRRAYRFRLRNIGQAHASDVDAWLIDQDEREVSEFDYTYTRLPGLSPNEEDELVVVVRDDEKTRNPLRLKVTWFDHRGHSDYISKVPVPRD